MRIYVDSNIFIRALEKLDPVAKLLESLLTEGNSRSHVFMTAEMTLSELLVIPYRDNNPVLIRQYEDIFAGGEWLSVLPLNRGTFRRAARLRAGNKGLKLPDALHMAVALDAGCTFFLTGDEGIKASLLQPMEEVRTAALADLTILRPDIPTLETLLQSLNT
jgi:predicted nucleic acid-binding protein